ncbi:MULTISPECIES: elongation factor G [unclassified Rhizobium]|uniref:elongation factor G n=1 Tax=unclassified Rhizobium TaxID=2613769 RepID=UPI00104AD242|nr:MULTISPECIES: elongation factor G [unclassified Rhizobium]MBB3395718.1 elongation factor G [Rhizobium sp. BK060]MBB4168368.1 elongation factor G [Rhizobium sp. BK538]TCM79796.1 elongation factor G [Rhizobium sp. BK068]
MRCFTVLGPSQTGKTTLVAKLASLEGTPRKSASPYGSSLTEFDFKDEAWCAIDTPGANEALALAQDALLVSDACILCISPTPDEAVLAAPYLRAIEASGTPCVAFINRMDEPRGRLRDVIAALQTYSNHPLVLRQVPIREGDTIVGSCDLISERAWRYREGQPSALIELPHDAVEREHEARVEMLEQLSEFDDWLLEELIEDREPASDTLFAISSRILKENRVIPVLFGAASHSNGIMRLMKALRHEAPPAAALRTRLAGSSGAQEAELSAVSFHAYHKANVGKTVLIRAFADGLKQGASLGGATLGPLQEAGSGKPISGTVQAGGIFAALKSDHLPAPALLTLSTSVEPPDWTTPPTPMLERILVPGSERDETKLSATLAKLAETDRGLKVMQEEGTGAALICAQGPVHLRDLRKTLSEVFRVEVSDRAPNPIYRETISKPSDVRYRHRKQTGGAGQFADVQLSVRPNERGQGFTFGESVKGGTVPRNYIPAVEAGAREAMEKGPLGFQVIDVDVTLTDGQYHSVDSSDFAFRAAGKMGVKQALSQASAVLMQPVIRVDIHIPSVYSGGMVTLVSSLKGQVLGFDRDENAKGWDIFRALVPGGVLEELARSLKSATQGIGHFSKTFDHFEELYGKEADTIINTHGSGAQPH